MMNEPEEKPRHIMPADSTPLPTAPQQLQRVHRDQQQDQQQHITGRSRLNLKKSAADLAAAFICTKNRLHTALRSRNPAKCGTTPSLNDRFFDLPAELRLHILSFMDLETLVALARTSSPLRHFVRTHEHHICTSRLTAIPIWYTVFYPPPTPCTLQYLQTISTYGVQARSLGRILAPQIVKEMLGRRTHRSIDKDLKTFIHQRLSERMPPLLLAVRSFFDVYPTKPAEEIMKKFPDRWMLQIHHMWHLFVHLIFRRFRCKAPLVSWRGTRGGRPTNEDFVRILMHGGIQALADMYALKGAYRRRRAFRKYLEKLGKRRGVKIRVPPLEEIWTPPMEKLLIERGVLQNLAHMGCCGMFVRSMLGEDTHAGGTGATTADQDVDETQAWINGMAWASGDMETWEGEEVWEGEEESEFDEDEDEDDEEDDEDEDDDGELEVDYQHLQSIITLA